MQLFFWFSISLLAFASFAFLTIPIFSKARSADQSPSFSLRLPTLIFGVVLMLSSLGLYTYIGSPNMLLPVQKPQIDPKFTAIIEQVEAHLAQNPEDAEGWQVIAPTYFRQNQAEKAFDAYANAIKYGKSTGKNWLGLGKANLMMNKGVFGPMTKVAFTKAQEKSPDNVEAMYFYAAMLQEAGEIAEAKLAIDQFISAHDFTENELLPLAEILQQIKQIEAIND